ncbi:hypothetical protein L3i22_003510 [Actinoplanes sp. L3-i22]|nr:hypothetical protein L3i22_003510 [Actinoplanes sp. L3-i22]
MHVPSNKRQSAHLSPQPTPQPTPRPHPAGPGAHPATPSRSPGATPRRPLFPTAPRPPKSPLPISSAPAAARSPMRGRFNNKTPIAMYAVKPPPRVRSQEAPQAELNVHREPHPGTGPPYGN